MSGDLSTRIKGVLALALADADRKGVVSDALQKRAGIAFTIDHDDELAEWLTDALQQAERYARARNGLVAGVREAASAPKIGFGNL